jgi:hypothetical protein
LNGPVFGKYSKDHHQPHDVKNLLDFVEHGSNPMNPRCTEVGVVLASPLVLKKWKE